MLVAAAVGVAVVVGMPATTGVVLLMVVLVPIPVRMPASVPIDVNLVVGMGTRVFILQPILRTPLRMGMSARFTVFVTVRFDGAGVRHGGFLARFVV
jgi:hypothetical protein